MKKIFATAIILMFVLTLIVFTSSSVFGVMDDDGYAVPSSTGIYQALASEGFGDMELVEVQYDDVVYKSAGGYFVGEERNKIDVSYPLFARGGQGLRFFGEDNYLVTPDAVVLQSFTGLYVSEGVSYNPDMTRADEDEFIMLSLPNGLYMNVQHSKFKSSAGEVVVPVNSILLLNEDTFSWYSYANGTLSLSHEQVLSDSTLTIGRYEYNYTDLLDAMGLIREALKTNPTRPDEEKIEEAEKILNKKAHGGIKNPGSGNKETSDGTDEISTEDGTGGSSENNYETGMNEGLGFEEGIEGQGGFEDDFTEGNSDTEEGGGDDFDAEEGDDESLPDEDKGEGDEGDAEGDSEQEHNHEDGDSSGGDMGGHDDDDESESESLPEGEGSGNEGTDKPPEYLVPTVKITKLEPWSYALNIGLDIDDPSGVIVRGVRIAVFRDIKGDKGKGSSYVNELGYECYPSADYEGKSAILRKTKTVSDEFPINTLPPGEDVYFQYNYRYNTVETNPETGLEKIVRKYVYSDLMKISVPEIEGNVKPFASSWNTEFAASHNSLTLSDMEIRNTSGYDPDAEKYSFENFKLDTIPYITRIELVLSEDGAAGGEEKIIPVTGSSIKNAAEGNKPSFSSSSPKLNSNKKYNYEVRAKDRFGNIIPSVINGSSNYQGTVYTAKKSPSVNIIEKENITDTLTVVLEVSDPDGGLDPAEPLTFRALNNRTGEPAYLEGLINGEVISKDNGGISELKLEHPKDGAKYEIKIDSLAFAQLYNMVVTGSYDPQPDFSDAPSRLEKIENVEFGTSKIYTASLSSGVIGFATSTENLLDTSVTLNAGMTRETTVEMLPLVDEFRFIVKGQDGKEITRSVLQREKLIKDGYTYDEDTASVVLEEGTNDISKTYLYGKKKQFTENPWKSFCIERLDPIEGTDKVEYTDPMKLKIDIPKGKLNHNTPYILDIEAVVIKSGQEYLIPVSISNSNFRTKKTIPQVIYSDLFLVADRAEFLDLKILDPDVTILNDGRVTLQLFRGNTRLDVKEITADTKGDAPVQDVIFDGLIEGEEYSIKFFADAYNDAEGYGSYETDHLLKTFNFIAGRSLFGSLTLQDLDRSKDPDGSFFADLLIKTNDTKGYLLREGEKPEIKLLIEHSDSMELPEYDEKPFLEEMLQLNKNEDGSLSLSLTKTLTGLYPNDGYRATLSTTYQGKYVLLDMIEFRTDTPYVSVSTHAQLIAAQKADNKANILVTSDFVQDQNESVSNFNGTIDFQGHVVTKGDKIGTYFLRIGTLGKVRNLVYDYPNEPYYVNTASIFETIYGKIENVIVRTNGNIEVNKSWRSVVASSISTTGSITNLIVKLNGDVITTSEEDTTIGALISSINGHLQNAYVYGRGGYIGRRAARGSSLWGYSYYNGIMENVFSIVDSWYQPNNNNYFLHAQRVYAAKVKNYYNVGDYYHIGAGENKTYLIPINYIPFAPEDNYEKTYDNVWAITGRGYKDKPDFLNTGTIALLSDTQWQKNILGDGFDVEGPVKMGFYPRLKLPNEMQKYQEYIQLPRMGDVRVPEVVSDSWDDRPDHGHTLDSGYIKLKLKNDSNNNIDSIDIEGLDTLVTEQGPTAEGFYEVCLSVRVSDTNPEYLSEYKINGITYNVGNIARTASSDYVTKNVEFWKSIENSSDWAGINSNMHWNYKLTSDIDFAKTDLIPAEMMLNGSRTSMSSTTAFTGKLDGQEHVISNFKLENVSYPYIFYQIVDSEIKNIFFDNLHISASPKTTRNMTGIVGLSYRSLMENIRIKNSTILGTGRCGYICGHTQYGTMSGCSVTDSFMGDVNTGITLTMGGLAGESYSHTESCYTNNLTMEVTNSTVVNTVAGLIGYINANLVEDCYTYGSIKVSGNYVGGLIGKAPVGNAAHTKQCVTYVNITQISGDYAGGYAGLSPSGENSIVLGNVAGSGTEAHRIKGKLFQACNAYAFQGQIVGQLKETDKDDAKELISGERLGRMDTWQDDIRLGSAWDYQPVKRGCVPKVKKDAEREGWKQKDIFLPGQSGDPVIRVTEAIFDGKKYGVYAEFDHPNIKHDVIKGLVNITFDGMNISDAHQEAKRASVEIRAVEGLDEKSLIVIETDEFLKALDTYPLVIKYQEPSGRQRELTSMVEFRNKKPDGEPYHNWWEVSNIGQWNQTIKEHGRTSENIKITGKIDFTGNSKNPDNRNLSFNRLSGENSDCGFINLNHEALSAGQPWIEKIGIDLSNLYFYDFIIDYSKSELSKPMNGAILSVNDVSNIVINNLTMSGNRYARNNFAFISNSSGKVNNVKITNASIYDTEPKLGGTASGAGALIATSNNDIDNVTAENIKVTRPKNTRVGAVVGNATYYGPSFCNNSVKNFEVSGYSDVGALSGGNYAGKADNLTAENGTVNAYSTAGGLIGYVSMYQNRTNKNRNWTASNIAVTSEAGAAGGITGTTFHFENKYMLVENCNITGKSYVGGVAGALNSGTIYLYDVEVVNCNIKNTGDAVLEPKIETTGTGGIVGRLVTTQTFDFDSVLVRNTDIEGPNFVGGIAGLQVRDNKGTNVIRRAYIAEDVTITCRNKYAGGLMGYSEIVDIRDCACGASVKSDLAAGGLIGKLNPVNDEIATTLERAYFNGKVYSVYNYAGGVVGVLDSMTVKTSDENMKNILVHADVRAGGPDASLWVNDTMPVGDAGTGFIYISEDSLLNGQKAVAIKNTAESSGRTTYIVPSRKDKIELLIPTSKFKEVGFYKDTLKFSDSNWKFVTEDGSSLKTYMPFTKNNDGDGILANIDRVYDKSSGGYVSAGILIPEFKTFTSDIAVYAAGPDILNIEVYLSKDEPVRSIKVNDSSINTDSNGVISLQYDFADPLVINGVSYDPSKLSRKVMTFGDYFYYIHTDGSIHYGKAVGTDTEEEEKGTIKGIPEGVKALNLYKGKALASDKKVYDLADGKATEGSRFSAKDNLKALDAAVPFYKTPDMSVFHNFTYVNGVKIPYRVFKLGEQFFTVDPYQDTLYDGVILSQKLRFNDLYQYFALLESDKKIHAYINNMVSGGLINEGIDHISNNMGYSGTVMLAYYPDGTVIGVDYTTGKEVCNNNKQATGFVSYVKNSLASLFAPDVYQQGVSDGTVIEADGTVILNNDGDLPGKITDNQTSGKGESGKADGEDSGKTPSSGNSKSEGSKIPDDKTSGQQSEGKTPLDETSAETSSTDLTGEDTEAVTGDTTSSPVSDSAAISQEGVPALPGIPAEGSGMASKPSESQNINEASPLSDAEILKRVLGDNVIMLSGETGKPEIVDTAELLKTSDEETKKTAVKTEAPGEDKESSEKIKQADDGKPLNIFHGIARKLHNEEKQGFMLIAFAFLSAVLILSVIYFKVIRRKRR